MRGINKFIGIGTLGKDPDCKHTQSGSAVTNISIAINEKWKDKNGETQERTEWVKVTFFSKLAEIAGEYLKKGSQVYIEGKLRTDKYDKDGETRYSTVVVADEMQMLGGGERSDERQPARESGRSAGRDSARPPARSSERAPVRSDDSFPADDSFGDSIPF